MNFGQVEQRRACPIGWRNGASASAITQEPAAEPTTRSMMPMFHNWQNMVFMAESFFL